MIEVRNITKRFRPLTALNDVSLRIPQGEVVGLLGPNGAGKTTLFKILAGILYPDSGQVLPTGGAWPVIGFKPERLLFPNRLRVGQYLELVAGLTELSSRRAEEAVLQSLMRVDMLEAAGKRIKECSKGMRQRLGLAQALIGDPPLLLLDEPSNGLDPDGQVDMHERIHKLHAAGKTIVMSSHHLHEITHTCTELVILNRGQVHYQNSMADALAMRTHTVIQAGAQLGAAGDGLRRLHEEIEINGDSIVLPKEATGLRRQVLLMLLESGFDVVRLEQKRVTLAEIYAEAVK
jgi:ABC-2 type transport system ATP-binding protein